MDNGFGLRPRIMLGNDDASGEPQLLEEFVLVVTANDIVTNSNSNDGPGDEIGIPTADQPCQSFSHNGHSPVHLVQDMFGFDVAQILQRVHALKAGDEEGVERRLGGNHDRPADFVIAEHHSGADEGVRAAGADSLAVITDIFAHADPQVRTSEWLVWAERCRP